MHKFLKYLAHWATRVSEHMLGVFYKIAVYCRCLDISALIKAFMYKNRFFISDVKKMGES